MTRKLMARHLILAALALILGLGGCTVLAPQKDETHYFVLTPVQGGAASKPPASATSPAITLGLGPITMPAYLDRPEVVIRSSETELRVSDSDRWGERLETNVTQVLASDLSGQLGARQIITYPWRLKTPMDYSVSVAFQRFERTAENHAVVQASWTIRNGTDEEIILVGSTSINEPSGPDNASAAQALSRGLAQVSRDIAQFILTVRAQDRAAEH